MKELLINVEGMHCGGCEKRIQNAVSDIDGVESVEVSLENKNAKITCNKEWSDDKIKEAIKEEGFVVVNIK